MDSSGKLIIWIKEGKSGDKMTYTASEAGKRLAEIVGRDKPFSKQYIHKLCKNGVIKHIKVSGNNFIVITEEDLLDYVKKSYNPQVGRPKNS